MKNHRKPTTSTSGGRRVLMDGFVETVGWLVSEDPDGVDESKRTWTRGEEQQESPGPASYIKSTQGDGQDRLAITETTAISSSSSAPDSPVAQAVSHAARVGRPKIDTRRDRSPNGGLQSSKPWRFAPNTVRHLPPSEKPQRYLPHRVHSNTRLTPATSRLASEKSRRAAVCGGRDSGEAGASSDSDVEAAPDEDYLAPLQRLVDPESH